MKEKVVVCDVDGCLLDIFKLYKEIAGRQLINGEMWDFFYKNANNPKYAVKIKEKNLIVQAMVLNEAIETRERALKDIKEIAKILGKRIPFFETEQIARDLQAILTVINEVLSE